jgi:hypothetical protein
MARDETSIARGLSRLICDLTRAVWVFAAVAGVDDEIAMVLVVHIPAGNDDGVGTLQLGSADAGLSRAVDKRLVKFAPVDEELADLDPRRCSKESTHGQFPLGSLYRRDPKNIQAGANFRGLKPKWMHEVNSSAFGGIPLASVKDLCRLADGALLVGIRLNQLTEHVPAKGVFAEALAQNRFVQFQ